MRDERVDLMKRIGRAMLLPADQSGLVARRPDGTRPVIAALATDPVAEVLRAVRSSGGVANVVTADGPHLVVFTVREDGDEIGADDIAIHPDTRMDMFLELIRHEHHVRTYVIEPDAVLTVDEPHQLLAPA